MLKGYMIGLGYSDSEADKIISACLKLDYKVETLYKKISDIFNFLLSLGLSNKEILKITNRYPYIYSSSVSSMKERIPYLVDELGYTIEEIFNSMDNYSHIIGYSPEWMEKKINNIMSLGYSRKDVIMMMKSYPRLNTYSIENMRQKIDDLMEMGYSYDDVIKMTKMFPNLYGSKISSLKKRFNDVMSLGYSYDDVIKITKVAGNFLTCSLEHINKRIDEIVSLGFTREEVLKLFKDNPSICRYSYKTIKEKADGMVEYGYSYKGAIKIIVKNPQIIGLSVESIIGKIDEIIKLGYTKEEVIDMTLRNASIFTYSTKTLKENFENIISQGYSYGDAKKIFFNYPQICCSNRDSVTKKINFYNVIGISSALVNDSKQFIQGVELSYSRYMFYQSIGIIIDISNYKLLFINEERFVKKYGKTKAELNKLYNYKRCISNNNGKNIKKK